MSDEKHTTDGNSKEQEKKSYSGRSSGQRNFSGKTTYRGSKPSYGKGESRTSSRSRDAKGGFSNTRGSNSEKPQGTSAGDYRSHEYHGRNDARKDGNSHYQGRNGTNGSRSHGTPTQHGQARPAFRHDRPQNSSPERRETPHTDGLPARMTALTVIRDVTENGTYASLSLNEHLKVSGLSHQDRRLATRLVYDTLDNMIYLDFALSKFMARPDTDIKLRNVLRLGACQILIEDKIPESAATNTSVELCRKIGLDELVGVCNGILRNLIRGKDTIVIPSAEEDPVRHMSIRYSVPAWLVQRLMDELGSEEAEKVMATSSIQKYTTLRPNLMEMTNEQFEQLLTKKVWEHEKGALPFSWRVRSMADIGLDNDFISGAFSIQGEGSMMAAMACEPKRGMQVLDCCAAPGGKACLLAEMMQGTGRVQAWDVHPHRVELIAAAAKRLKLENVRPIVRDATVLKDDLTETMDVVLLDAPCTGMGELSDKPDIRYRLTPENMDEIIRLQEKLLSTVSGYVKRGGTLVYSTCSLLPSENKIQIERFISQHPDFEIVPLPESIPESIRKYEDKGLQLLPYRDGMAGFYICKMRRK